MTDSDSLVGLTGTTGYIGGRLLPLLERRAVRVRCLTRRPESLANRVPDGTEVVRADVLDFESLATALEGVETAFYLVHSMGAPGDFEENDRQGAANFAAAAKQNGVRRIVYLGGLGDATQKLSPHLRSRHEVGEVLRCSKAQVIEFRASVVIGSGSLSFELIRALVERLPMMICPRWVSTATQPIAVEDILAYLLAALDLDEGESHVFEIGGPDQVSYGDIMREYARQRGLRRLMISVPVLTPRLSSLWLGLVTPVYARVGRKLVEGVRNPTLVHDTAALDVFDIQPRGLRDAIERALVNEDRELAATRWSDALSSGSAPHKWGGARFGSRIVDSKVVAVDVPADAAFAPIQQIGGQTGWYYATWLWHLRGWLDLLVGGVGMRRGRRDPLNLAVGDALDFWRVEAFAPHRQLRLAAEMRIPGRAWLEFDVTEVGAMSRIRQTAIFDPVGLLGLAYWYALYPLHQLVFARMLSGIARAAEKSHQSAGGSRGSRPKVTPEQSATSTSCH
jgi:uncharacterized protein YbjT (DUF2867 family)